MSDVVVIDMQDRAADCVRCGLLANPQLGIPVYEDVAVPNDWTGEWFGAPACDECFDWQGKLTHPVIL